MVLICFRLDPFTSRGGGGYLVYSLDPRANPHSERFLQTHLRPHRSPSGFPFSRDRRWERLSSPAPLTAPRALREAKPHSSPGPGVPFPGTPRRSSARTAAATGPAAGRPRRGPRPDDAIGRAAQRCRTGPGCGAALHRRKSPFLFRKEKLPPPHTHPPPPHPRIFHLQ